MLFLLLQQAPAETSNFMIAGYAVIFSVIFLYVVSIILRNRNLRRDMTMLEELEKKGK
jgi:CcmD family protein